MRVSVMQVGIVRVPVRHRRMGMRMDVRLAAVPREVVRVAMVRVVRVRVRMLQRIVAMRVRVALAQMQPDAERHERRRDPENAGGACGQNTKATSTPKSGATEK